MRISTAQLYQQSVSQILNKQTALGRLQAQIASGKRILSPADDPAAAARVLDIDRQQELTRQFQTNADLAMKRLENEESIIAAATTTVQRVRELALRGRNTHLTDDDRRFVAAEVRERLKELVALGNTIDGNGDFLFAGHQAKVLPFTQDATTGLVTYNGDQGSRLIEVSPGRTIADGDPGDAVFMAIRNGNGTFVTGPNPANTGSGVIVSGGVTNAPAWTGHDYRIVFTTATTFDVIDDTTATTIAAGVAYTDCAAITNIPGVSVSISGAPATGDEFNINPSANQSVFATIDNLADALETSIGTPAARAFFAGDVNRSLEDLDQALEKFLEVRATIGARVHAIEGQKNANEDIGVQLTALRSDLEDVNLVEAASQLQLELTTLQAAERAFARTQGLSLFDFL